MNLRVIRIKFNKKQKSTSYQNLIYMRLDFIKIEKQIYYLLKKNTDKTPYGLNNGDCIFPNQIFLKFLPSKRTLEKD